MKSAIAADQSLSQGAEITGRVFLLEIMRYVSILRTSLSTTVAITVGALEWG